MRFRNEAPRAREVATDIDQDVKEAALECFGKPKPRNPRHFDGIEGGRKRVSDTFTHKNSGSCI